MVVQFKSHYQQLRESRKITLTRLQWRDLLYAFGRPLVPLWDESELYEAVDEFLDTTDL